MVVQVESMVKRYKETLAVDKVSLAVADGEIFGLLGPNGAGKTSLIHALLGIVQLDGGTVHLFGKNFATHEKEIKSRVGFVPQELAIFEDLTAFENVALFARLYGVPQAKLRESVEQALTFTGLSERRGHYPKAFSGGLKRRLNIACGIVHQPELVIMDEPTVGIDPQSRNHILDSVRTLNRNGAAIIYTSHYMEEVEALCTRVAIMDQGRIIASGSQDELKQMVRLEEKVTIVLEHGASGLDDKLKAVQGVRRCAVDEQQLAIVSQPNSNNLGRILDVLAEAGGQVLSVTVDKPTLELVFLTLTGRTLRD